MVFVIIFILLFLLGVILIVCIFFFVKKCRLKISNKEIFCEIENFYKIINVF